MSGVRVLVGTRKGAFILTSDGRRERWEVSGPHFAGCGRSAAFEGSPADPDRLFASQSSSWSGQVIQRSDDGGVNWEPVGNRFSYDGAAGTHQWYDGTPHPWEFARVWHLEPSLDDPDTVYAGVEDAGCSGRRTAADWSGTVGAALPSVRADLAAGCGRDVPAHAHPRPDEQRMFIAISAAGASRTDDAGQTWRPMNRGRSRDMPDPTAEVGHCVHRIAMHPAGRNLLHMQKHWDVMRSDDAGESWHEISGDLPTDFGFPIDVHAHEPERHLRGTDHERRRALPARGEASRLPEPDRRR